MNSKRKIEINIVEVQTYKILIQINSNNDFLLTNRVKGFFYTIIYTAIMYYLFLHFYCPNFNCIFVKIPHKSVLSNK